MKLNKAQKIMQNSELISNGVEIRNLTKTKIDAKFLRKIAQEIFSAHGGSAFILSVALVGPKRAQELNTIYRKKTYVPNVLSFDYGPPPFRRRGSPLWGGEIVLCPAKIRKDARTYGTMFQEELARVFVHGLLHLLGYTHKRMQKFEIPNFRV